MMKCSPVEMRKSLELSEAMKKAMIRFVPIPVISDDDYLYLMGILNKRLDKMEAESLKQEIPDPN